MSFQIISKDITKLDVDAIVNASNTSLQMGGGVCGAIFRAAGADQLRKACDMIGPIKTGQAVMTDGYNLKAKHIIHTAGPVFDSQHPEKSKELLENSYKNSLNLARKHNFKSIAFPLISAGIYGYPKKEAFDIAKNTINKILIDNDTDVYLTIIDKDLLDSVAKVD
ncbi:macro domain-containing protein [Anaerococcus sp. Marseille-Q5996]|uniref:macro domain-containing protein n=1 Tax=Anaerococcus sp. Marseille-Q5996 TaxID=2972769 RepID=UPI0021C6F702|nr:macro domain-containing protein [Anaerococcus sp. Marseille-Q5996]